MKNEITAIVVMTLLGAIGWYYAISWGTTKLASMFP